MLKNLLYSLPALLLAGCSGSTERYRDTHHLEIPPTLPIEHTQSQAAVGADDMKPSSSPLAGLIAFEEAAGKPVLTLKTRMERAWEMVATALKISDIEVLDKNRDLNVFQVRFDADNEGQDVGLIRSLLTNRYPEAEYTVTLKDESAGVVVNAALTNADSVAADEDGSPELVRLLHKVINDKIINRDPRKTEDE
jgi:uncharacterized lipoprotein